MPVYRPIIAATRVLDMLAATNMIGPSRLVDLATYTALNPATALRMLETLEAAGYVRRQAEDGRYCVTARALDLSCGVDMKSEVGACAAPFLDELQKEIGWPSDAAIFDRGAMLVVATSRKDNLIFSKRRPGYRAPLLETSLGKAYLAWLNPALRERLLADAGGGAEIAAELDMVRQQGYGVMSPAYSARDYDNAVSAIGVPVLSAGQPIAAVNVMYLRKTFSPDEAVERLLPALTRTAEAIAVAVMGPGDAAVETPVSIIRTSSDQ